MSGSERSACLTLGSDRPAHSPNEPIGWGAIARSNIGLGKRDREALKVFQHRPVAVSKGC
ncbi:MAG: hypothetical protein AAGH78_04160 [Cyanobacteria bacterium P01_H01_bin.58]